MFRIILGIHAIINIILIVQNNVQRSEVAWILDCGYRQLEHPTKFQSLSS